MAGDEARISTNHNIQIPSLNSDLFGGRGRFHHILMSGYIGFYGSLLIGLEPKTAGNWLRGKKLG